MAMLSRWLLHLMLATALLMPGAAVAQQKGSGRNQYEPITVQRGFTQDPSFSNWANGTQNGSQGNGSQGNGSQGSSKGSGTSKYNSITVQRGVTQDNNFANWAAGTQSTPKVSPVRIPTATIHIKP